MRKCRSEIVNFHEHSFIPCVSQRVNCTCVQARIMPMHSYNAITTTPAATARAPIVHSILTKPASFLLLDAGLEVALAEGRATIDGVVPFLFPIPPLPVPGVVGWGFTAVVCTLTLGRAETALLQFSGSGARCSIISYILPSHSIAIGWI